MWVSWAFVLWSSRRHWNHQGLTSCKYVSCQLCTVLCQSSQLQGRRNQHNTRGGGSKKDESVSRVRLPAGSRRSRMRRLVSFVVVTPRHSLWPKSQSKKYSVCLTFFKICRLVSFAAKDMPTNTVGLYFVFSVVALSSTPAAPLTRE
jgi:hypothetical protein